jgi:hypothetical protein
VKEEAVVEGEVSASKGEKESFCEAVGAGSREEKGWESSKSEERGEGGKKEVSVEGGGGPGGGGECESIAGCGGDKRLEEHEAIGERKDRMGREIERSCGSE